MHVHLRSLLVVSVAVASFAIAGCMGSVDQPSASESDSEHAGQSQSAVTSCHGTGCNGLSPDSSGCGADGTTVASCNVVSGGFVIGTVALRYSHVCGAVWTHTTSKSASYLRAEVRTPTGFSEDEPPTPVIADKSTMQAVFAGQTAKASGYIGSYLNDLRFGCGTSHPF
jgi:hypothetical protein